MIEEPEDSEDSQPAIYVYGVAQIVHCEYHHADELLVEGLSVMCQGCGHVFVLGEAEIVHDANMQVDPNLELPVDWSIPKACPYCGHTEEVPSVG